jgi:hypothetical protein
MKQNREKIFTKKLNKKRTKFKRPVTLFNSKSMFSRIPIQTHSSDSCNTKSETLKKIDAALGLLKLKTINKNLLE